MSINAYTTITIQSIEGKTISTPVFGAIDYKEFELQLDSNKFKGERITRNNTTFEGINKEQFERFLNIYLMKQKWN